MSAQPPSIEPLGGSVNVNIAEDSPLAILLNAARAGDPAAWNDIVDRFAGMVWAIARRHGLSVADAADVSRTTWLQLVDHLDDIEDPERIGGWLAMTARHESLRVPRRSDAYIAADEDDGIDLRSSDDFSVAARVLDDVSDGQLWELLSRLPPRSQLLLTVLSANSPLSDIEIGQALNIPTSDIGPTRRCCLQHLQRLAASRGIHAPPCVS